MHAEQIQKLPKWAQDEVHKLLNRVDSLEKLVHAKSVPDSRISIHQGYSKEEFGLDPHTRIRFRLGENRSRDYIEAHLRDGKVELMGGSQIIILPQVSNVAWVVTENESYTRRGTDGHIAIALYAPR